MENGAISDGQISASSQFDANHAAKQGRLHCKAGSWSAGNTNLHQWLQVDLGSQYIKVTRVATQGRHDYPQWVTKYKLQYSNDGVNFHYYREQGQTAAKVKYNVDLYCITQFWLPEVYSLMRLSFFERHYFVFGIFSENERNKLIVNCDYKPRAYSVHIIY